MGIGRFILSDLDVLKYVFLIVRSNLRDGLHQYIARVHTVYISVTNSAVSAIGLVGLCYNRLDNVNCRTLDLSNFFGYDRLKSKIEDL